MGSRSPLSEPAPGTTGRGRAAVIGAGIAGLCAAIALRRAGWDVVCYEKSRFKNEIGAAITVTANASRVLQRFGFDYEKAGAVRNQGKKLFEATSLGTMQEEYYGDDQETGSFWAVHRVDLHRGLRAIAEEMGVVVTLGQEVTGVNCEWGVVRFKREDEEEKRFDLVVIADGAHSQLIEDFLGSPSPVKRTGRSIYRWLTSMDEVTADPVLRQTYSGPAGFVAFGDKEMKVLWVTYMCRGGKVLNNAIVHDTRLHEENGGGSKDSIWHVPASTDQVLGLLDEYNFHPSVKSIVTMANEDGIKAHHLYKRPALESFIRGKTLVVGDAAHVMMPTHAAGGGIAIESAASLEVLFQGVRGSDEKTLKQRLEIWNSLRLPRCNLTMLASNAGPRWLHVPGVEEEVRKYYQGPLPPLGSKPYSKVFRDVLFKHDEYRTANEALDMRVIADNYDRRIRNGNRGGN